MNIQQNMSIMEKLAILTDAAKYDVACTSSGVDRKGDDKHMGNCLAAGVCHSFAADGRAYLFSRFFLQTSAFLIAPIARTTVILTFRVLPLRRMKSANSRWSFTEGIILRVFS